LPMMRAGVSAAGSEAMIRIFAGLVFVALGVAACAEGGRRRERALAEHASRSGSFAPGLAMALASGLLASFMNVGISFGGPLAAQASAQGASDTSCVYAVWLPLLLGGAAPNLLYCVWLLTHRNTWAHYRGAFLVMNLCLAAAMAFFWFFGTALYGVASHALGAWGLVLGWPVFMAVIVIGAGLLSVATGEWRRSGTAPVIFQAAGILLLVFAIAFFSLAQNSLKHAEVNNASTSSLTSSRPSGSVYVR
jgi:L-rhamnose-H+ transport protein